MNPTAGQRVGPYEILGPLGTGGMGLVFSAWDSRLHRDVAIKLLRDELVREDSRERFLQEARAASGLNHPNICTIFDIGEQDGDPYLVMELLKGETLRGRMLVGPMTTKEILHVGIEVAEALAAAHVRGVIHRDIKPANIFLVTKPTGGWQVKVLDFGLAQVDSGRELDAHTHMTEIGSTVGTLSYMSPEQALGEDLDARSDLFGLGILLYEMAVGQMPFRGATDALVAVQLLNHPPEPLREFNKNIPREFEDIILKLLAKERSLRFQSATELVNALRSVVLRKPSQVRFEWLARASMLAASEAEERESSSAVSLPEAPTILPETSTAGRSSSSDVIRPIPRKPLPPVTLEPSIAHWTRSPLPAVETTTTEPLVVPTETSAIVTPEPAVQPTAVAETLAAGAPIARVLVNEIVTPEPVTEPLVASEPLKPDIAALRAAGLKHTVEHEQTRVKVKQRRWVLWVMVVLVLLAFAGITYWRYRKQVHHAKRGGAAILQSQPVQMLET